MIIAHLRIPRHKSASTFQAGAHSFADMASPLDYAPIAAACFAVPEFLPQLRKLAVTGDAAGVSWSWGVLTAVNNAAWLAYFALSAYWTALIPSASATILATALAVMLTRRGQARRRPAVAIGAWAALLTAAFALAGRAGLGTLLTAAFTLQVAPSIWAAYRTARPTGIATGTWLLTLGELTCWLAFGLHKSDPRLIILGAGGITCCALILARVRRRGGDRVRMRPRQPGSASGPGRCGCPRGAPAWAAPARWRASRGRPTAAPAASPGQIQKNP
jgi:uncharacterized protein with PQ loop repeat